MDALGFLADTPDRLETFLAQSGLAAEDLRARLDDPTLLAAVLGYLLSDDETLLTFCSETDCDSRDVHMAQHVLENA